MFPARPSDPLARLRRLAPTLAEDFLGAAALFLWLWAALVLSALG